MERSGPGREQFDEGDDDDDVDDDDDDDYGVGRCDVRAVRFGEQQLACTLERRDRPKMCVMAWRCLSLFSSASHLSAQSG